MEDLPTIQQLDCFVHYGHAGNFTTAAREVSITQSAFSTQIKKLEQTLGVTLIHRSKRGSELTPAGERFLPKAKAWLEEMRSFIYELRMEEGKGALELNVGILRMLGDVQMNAHIAHFERENDRIRFNVFDLEEDQLEAALLDGRIDVASTYLPPEGEHNPFEGFELKHFCWDTMVFYGPLLSLPETPLSRAELAAFPMVHYARQGYMHALMEEYLAGVAVKGSGAHLSTPYAMMMYCEENMAGALLPERLLRAMGREQGWAPLKEPLQCDACLIYRKKNPKKNAIRVYVSHVLQSFQDKGKKRAGKRD